MTAMDFTTGDREMRQEFMAALADLAGRDERIVFLESDLAASSGSGVFRAAHPERYFNCGIQEGNMLGVAAGLSAGGFVPVAHSFAAFASRRAADQAFLSCAYAGRDVRIVGTDPGVTGSANGGTHMALEDIALFRAMPGVVIIDASDPEMLKQALAQSFERPAVYYFRLTRKTKVRLYPAGTRYEIGKAHVAHDGGRDATIISAGFTCMVEALKAAELLAARGVGVRVLDMFTIAPLDGEAVLAAAAETGAIVTLDNHSITGGLGSAVAETLAGRACVPFARLGATSFGEVGTLEYVLEKFRMDAAAVAETALKLTGKQPL